MTSHFKYEILSSLCLFQRLERSLQGFYKNKNKLMILCSSIFFKYNFVPLKQKTLNSDVIFVIAVTDAVYSLKHYI